MSQINVGTIADAAGTGPVALTSQKAVQQTIQYDQTVPAIDVSFNVSSVDDDAAGIFTVHLTNAFSSLDFVRMGMGYGAATPHVLSSWVQSATAPEYIVATNAGANADTISYHSSTGTLA
jgi:hypothetical protein